MGQTEQTRAVVGDLLQRIGEGDPGKIAALYAEDVAWELTWPQDEYDGVVPWIKHRSTRADVEEHYRTVAEHTVAEESTAQVQAVMVDGAEAAVVGRLGQRLRRGGPAYQAEFILYLTVADGLITRHHIVEDNLTLRRAFDAAA